jgi:hypothetical protein
MKMDVAKRAETALKMLKTAMAEDDQKTADFLIPIIERDQLYPFYMNDAGKQITSMAAFVAEMNAESAAV